MENSGSILSGAITLVCIMIIVPGVISFLHSRSNKFSGKNEVKVHSGVFVIALVATIFYVGVVWITLYFEGGGFRENLSMIIMMLPLVLLGVILIMLYVNYKITFDAEGFTYRNFWRVARRYNYSEVTGIIEDKLNKKLVVGKKKLAIQSFSVGVLDFLIAIEEWRRKNGKSKRLPSEKETLFNDNIYDSEGFVAGWIIVLVILGAMILATFVASYGNGDYMGVAAIGGIWGLFFLSGLVFKFFVDRAEKYPRIVRLLVKPSYIKNPKVRERLGLDSPNKKRKK